MQHDKSHPETQPVTMSQKDLLTILLLTLSPSALTLWWVIHQAYS